MNGFIFICYEISMGTQLPLMTAHSFAVHPTGTRMWGVDYQEASRPMPQG